MPATTAPTCPRCGEEVFRPAPPPDVSREENEPEPAHYSTFAPWCPR